MFTGIVNLYDLTFVLLINEKVVLAVSYKNNANSLLSLFKQIHLGKLIYIVEPMLWTEESNDGLVLIEEFTANNIKFGIPYKDLEIINKFSIESGAEVIQMVNLANCFTISNNIPTFMVAKCWRNQYAILSFENNELKAMALCNSIKELYDLIESSALDRVYNESDIIDIFKIKSQYP